jgi:UDP-glucose 4-epimerase
MLKHLNSSPAIPARTVVLGAAGFVGGAVARGIAARGGAVLALTRDDVDFLAPGAPQKLAGLLLADDAVVAVAARAPCRNAQMLAENMQIVLTMTKALALRPVAHVVNLGSDAVFADIPVPITENGTPKAPDSVHGAMHLAREIAFMNEVASPLAIVRPTLIYGAADPHNGYGPNQFRRKAEAGEDIVLFGEGEERRDHVFIDDVAEIILRILERRSVGNLNIATGEVISFKDVAALVVEFSGGNAQIKSRPRSGPMPHDGYRPFDISACKAAFPDFKFLSLREALLKMSPQGARRPPTH